MVLVLWVLFLVVAWGGARELFKNTTPTDVPAYLVFPADVHVFNALLSAAPEVRDKYKERWDLITVRPKFITLFFLRTSKSKYLLNIYIILHILQV